MKKCSLPILRIVLNFTLTFSIVSTLAALALKALPDHWVRGWVSAVIDLAVVAFAFWLSLIETRYWFSDWVAYQKKGVALDSQTAAESTSAQSA